MDTNVTGKIGVWPWMTGKPVYYIINKELVEK